MVRNYPRNAKLESLPSERADFLSCVLISAIALSWFLFDRPSELFGDDDFVYALLAARAYDVLNFVSADLHSAPSILAYLAIAAFVLLFERHGAFPLLYIGLVYGLFDLFGIPFNTSTIQIPVALLASVACVLFYKGLRAADLPISICFAGALLLAFSPIFAAAARGIATLWIVGVVFNMALSAYALQRLNGSLMSRVLVAFAGVNVIWGDQLAYLTILAFVVSFGLRRVEWRWSASFPKDAWHAMSKGLGPLADAVILWPCAIAALLLVITSIVVAVIGDRLEGTAALYSPLLEPFIKYGNDLSNDGNDLGGVRSTFSGIHEKLEFALGVGGPFLIGALIIASTVVKTRLPTPFAGVLWSYAVIAGSGYVLLFYFIAPQEGMRTARIYQLYALVPIVTALMILASQLLRVSQSARVVTHIGIVIALGLSLYSSIHYIWKAPIRTWSKTFETYDSNGLHYPDHGTKAIGLIVRSSLAETWGDDPGVSVVVTVAGLPRIYRTSLLFYSGMVQDQYWFTRRLGHRPNVTVAFRDKGDDCDARVCVVLSAVESAPNVARADYAVVSNSIVIAQVTVVGLDSSTIAPGSHPIENLENAFDTRFYKIWDYFEPAATPELVARVSDILGSICWRLPFVGESSPDRTCLSDGWLMLRR